MATHILLSVFLFVMASPYSQEESQKTIADEASKWTNDFIFNEQNVFWLEQVQWFFIQAIPHTQKVRARGKAYFKVDDELLIPQTINPQDASKVYIYSPKGLIIATQQFFHAFYLQFEGIPGEQYKILFTGGPPSPKKMIIFEIDFEKIGNFDMSFSPEQYQELDQRVANLKQQIAQWMNNKNVGQLSFIQNAQNLVKVTTQQNIYLVVEALVVILCTVFQVRMIKKLLGQQTLI